MYAEPESPIASSTAAGHTASPRRRAENLGIRYAFATIALAAGLPIFAWDAVFVSAIASSGISVTAWVIGHSLLYGAALQCIAFLLAGAPAGYAGMLVGRALYRLARTGASRRGCVAIGAVASAIAAGALALAPALFLVLDRRATPPPHGSFLWLLPALSAWLAMGCGVLLGGTVWEMVDAESDTQSRAAEDAEV